jgi:hypothetical protein
VSTTVFPWKRSGHAVNLADLFHLLCDCSFIFTSLRCLHDLVLYRCFVCRVNLLVLVALITVLFWWILKKPTVFIGVHLEKLIVTALPRVSEAGSHSFTFCALYIVILLMMQEWGPGNKSSIIYQRHSSVFHHVFYTNLNLHHYPGLCLIWIPDHSWKGKSFIIYLSYFNTVNEKLKHFCDKVLVIVESSKRNT